jgi:Holliday junction resolvase
MNKKSDVRAKEAFIHHLLSSGYSGARVISSPSDIIATKNNEEFYFEIKYTAQSSKYFGAATLTEWEAALEMKGNYRFVVALERDERWHFHEYTPEEFMNFSTIPPFKIFFNIPVDGGKAEHKNKSTKSIKLTEDRLVTLSKVFKEIRGNSESNT